MRNAVLSVLILILAVLATPALRAQAAPAQPEASAASSGAPVPVPVPSAKAVRYYRSGNLLWAVDTLWEILIPALLLFTGLSARLRDLARRLGRNWFFTLAIYGVLFTLLLAAVSLPLNYYEEFVRPHAYGLSAQTAAKWWHDTATGVALGCAVMVLFLWIPYLLLKKSPRRWWLYSGLTALPLLVLLLFVTPIWIEPLFNKFGPMKDKALESQILALAGRAGIEGSRVFEVEKSVDTNTVNAYVNGFGSSKRVVLWDTTLAKLDPRQVLFVTGHEMGHYVLGHTYQLILLGTVLALFGAWVIHLTAGELIARYRGRFGFGELGDVASLPLVILLLTLVSLVLSPAILAFGRHTEHEADRFGLEITRDNHACATAFVKLQQENLSLPRPGLLIKLMRADHPPLGERIDFCNEYKPWETGQPLRYQDKIR